MNDLNIKDPCPAGAYERTVTVRAEDTDDRSRMKPGALVREMQTTGCRHLETFGLGSRSLMPEGYLWMLIRTSLHIERLPTLEETLVLRDWYGPAKHWMYPGRYVCFSGSGETLASAVSQWMLVDARTRTLTDPPALMERFPAIAVDGEMPLPARKAGFPAELPQRTERVVSPAEIDLNGHMNNTHYLDWATALPEEAYRRSHFPTDVWVEYSQELMEGERVPLRFAREADTLFLRGGEGEGAFALRMDFAPEAPAL